MMTRAEEAETSSAPRLTPTGRTTQARPTSSLPSPAGGTDARGALTTRRKQWKQRNWTSTTISEWLVPLSSC